MKIETPTPDMVKEYNKKFESDKTCYLADQAIIKLVEKFKENKDITNILLKVSVINDLYNTNIFDTCEMAKHIHSLHIDSALEKGDSEIVDKIAKVKLSHKEKNFYSFATKYCNWHNRSKYPIYDGFVDKILRAYRDQTNFFDFNNTDLRDYAKFLEILENFRRFFNLDDFDFKEIDKFLWRYSREVFKK